MKTVELKLLTLTWPSHMILSDDWQKQEHVHEAPLTLNNKIVTQEHVHESPSTLNNKIVSQVGDFCRTLLQDKGTILNSNLSYTGSAAPSPTQISLLPRVVYASNEEEAEHGHAVDGSLKACNAATINVSTESPKALIDDGVGGSRRDQLLRGPRIIKRTTSCPPSRDRFATTDPWSLEWVKSQNLDIVGGNLPSAKHVSINSSSTSGLCVNKKKVMGICVIRRKV